MGDKNPLSVNGEEERRRQLGVRRGCKPQGEREHLLAEVTEMDCRRMLR